MRRVAATVEAAAIVRPAMTRTMRTRRWRLRLLRLRRTTKGGRDRRRVRRARRLPSRPRINAITNHASIVQTLPVDVFFFFFI